MKSKLLKTGIILQLCIYFGLSIFYSCSQDDFEPTFENDIENEVIEEDSDDINKSNNSYGAVWVTYTGRTSTIYSTIHKYPNDNITVSQLSTGRYEVTYPGFGYLVNGIPHVIAYRGNHSAQIENWLRSGNDLKVLIRCFSSTGNPINGGFVTHFMKKPYNPDVNDAHIVYDTHRSNFNSKGLSNKITRFTTGTYFVEFSGLKSGNIPGGLLQRRFQISSYGTQPTRCQISWTNFGTTGAVAIIKITDTSGNRIDSGFILSCIESPDIASKNYVSAQFHINDTFIDKGFLPPSNLRTIIRWTDIPGTYRISPITYARPTMYMASSYGGDGSYVSIKRWNRSYLEIEVYNSDGTPKTDNPYFNLQHSTEREF